MNTEQTIAPGESMSTVEEFQVEREEWELEKRAELQRLREEAALLAEGWKQLEHEQRRLLAERELLHKTNQAGSASPSLANGDPGGPSQPISSPDRMAWSQLQKLRREIADSNRCRQTGRLR